MSIRNSETPGRAPRAVLLLLVLALVASACATSVDTDEAEDAGGAATDDAADDGGDTAASDAEGELSLWYLSDHEVQVEDAIERFNGEYPDVSVDARPVENDPYKTTLQTAMGTDAQPDVFHNWTGGWLQQFVEAGLVAPMDDYMDANPEWAGELASAAIETATFDDQVYAAPTIMGAAYMWYRTDIFEEHGIEVPETYDELLEVVETLNAEGVTPFSLANGPRWPGAFWLMYLAARAGGPEPFLDAYNREEGGTFEHESYIEAGERIQQLVEMDAFVDGFNGLNYDTGDSRAPLYTGDAAMELMGDWTLNAIRDESPEMADDFDFFTFPAIEPPEGTGGQEVVVGGANGAFSVSEGATDQELAFELVRYLSDAQAAQIVVDEALGTPAVTEGVEIEDPFLQRFVDTLANAEYLQLYYDQFLPPGMAETHLETTQQLFGGSITPEEAARTMEEEAEAGGLEEEVE